MCFSDFTIYRSKEEEPCQKLKIKEGRELEGVSIFYFSIGGSKYEVLASFQNLDVNGGKLNLWT